MLLQQKIKFFFFFIKKSKKNQILDMQSATNGQGSDFWGTPSPMCMRIQIRHES